MRISLIKREHYTDIWICKCGMEFKVGKVLESESANPVIELNRPLGLNAVNAICKRLMEAN